jgi:hypothetical protein
MPFPQDWLGLLIFMAGFALTGLLASFIIYCWIWYLTSGEGDE